MSFHYSATTRLISVFCFSFISDGISIKPDSYDMSSTVITITSMNVAASSVKLSWPAVIKDIQSIYVVEGRATSHSHIWKVHAAGLFATSCIIKGLDLSNYNYEFRVRTKNPAGMGEPSQSASTAAYRPPGDAPSSKSRLSTTKYPANTSNTRTNDLVLPLLTLNRQSVQPHIPLASLRSRVKPHAKRYVRSFSGPSVRQIRSNSMPRLLGSQVQPSMQYTDTGSSAHGLCVGMAVYKAHGMRRPYPTLPGVNKMSTSCIFDDY